MDKGERQRLKTLAVDTIVKSPVHSIEAQLAEALEQCVEWIDDTADKCEHCRNRKHHGDRTDSPTIFTKI